MREKTKELLTAEKSQADAGLQPSAIQEVHDKEHDYEKSCYSAPVRIGTAASPDPVHFNNRSRTPTIDTFQKSYGNLSTLRHFNYPIQAKLNVSQPNDPYEQEADRVAEQVLSMPESAIQRKPGLPGSSDPSCRDEQLVQQKISDQITPVNQGKVSSPTSEVTPAMQSRVELISSNGQALPDSVRSYFEPRLGYDLSDVRMHTDSMAGESARSVKAKAFTLGRNIVFGEREYAPETGSGQRLLAHELTHVIQQTRREGSGNAQFSSEPGVLQRQESSESQCIAPKSDELRTVPPEKPPAAPSSVSNRVEIEVPELQSSGGEDAARSTVKKCYEFSGPVELLGSVVLYAIPRSALSSTACTEGATLTQEELDKLGSSGQPSPALPPVSVNPAGTPAAPAVTAPASLPDIGPVLVNGDYVITARYTKFAVGAGSISVIKTAKGISLIDGGVGEVGRAELTKAILDQVAGIVGDKPIAEILTSHLHEDHTSLMVELARRFRIGAIRTNMLQLSDPAMVKFLQEIARAQAKLIADQFRQRSAQERAAWEADPTSGKLASDPAAREAAWRLREQQLIAAEIERSGIALENMYVSEKGTFEMSRSPIGDLAGEPTAKVKLPKTEKAPVLLEQGFLDIDPVTGLPRATLAHPELSQDIESFAAKSAKDPKAKLEGLADTHENSYVIEMGGARLMILPDKRGPDIEKFKSVLATDVARLNAALKILGRPPASLQVWEMTHHLQRGFLTSVAQMETMIETLHDLVHADLPQGGKTRDILVVSGQEGSPGVRNLLDPAIAWFLEMNGIRVHVATTESIKILDVLLPGGQRVAGLVSGIPYLQGAGKEATLRQSETAIRFLKKQIGILQQSKPSRKGTPSAEYKSKGEAIDQQVKELDNFLKEIKQLRHKCQEELLKDQRPKKQGAAVTPAPEAGSPMLEALRELQFKLGDPRLKGMQIEGAAESAVFDPVALHVLNEPSGGFTIKQLVIVDALKKADALREKLKTVDSLENRAELVAELTRVRAGLEEYLETAPAGTKELLTARLQKVISDIGDLTKGGGAEAIKTAMEGFTVEQRVVAEKAAAVESPWSKRVETGMGVANRGLGAVMIYTLVKKQKDLEQNADLGKVSGLESVVGTMHNYYGVTIGVRMMRAVPVSPWEMLIISVLDIFETGLHRATTDAQWNAALAYSGLRNGLQLGLLGLSMYLAKLKNPWVNAAGFALQLAVDPILRWTGIYDAFERAFDPMPNTVTGVKQKLLRDLLGEYGIIIGLLDLQDRSSEELPIEKKEQEEEARKEIASSVVKYREKALKTEHKVLAAFAEAYTEAQTGHAGLPELDIMRDRFLMLQEKVRRSDYAHGAESRRQIIATFEKIESTISLGDKTSMEIRAMPQWKGIRDKIGDIRSQLKGSPDWEDAAKYEGELQQMLRNARYRLEPASFGLRSESLLPKDSEARTVYVEELEKCEAATAKLHDEIAKRLGGPALTDQNLPNSTAELTILRAELALKAYRAALSAQPALVGVTPETLRASAYQIGPVYAAYLDEHKDYKTGLERLQLAEYALDSTLQAANRANADLLTSPQCAPLKTRLESLRTDAVQIVKERQEKHGFVFQSEAETGKTQLRAKEQKTIAKQMGDLSSPLSPEEQLAVAEVGDDAGLISTKTVGDRLNKITELSIEGPEGYVSGIYRYVDGDKNSKESDNVFLGRTGDTRDLPYEGDKERRYICLNDAAYRRFPKGEIYLLYTASIATLFQFSETERCLQRVKLSELKK